MIKELPHMIEKMTMETSPIQGNTRKLECTCGAVWIVSESENGYNYKVEEGNGLCELPTLYHRWESLRETMRLFSLAI